MPVTTDGLIVLDEFYALMLQFIAQKKFPDITALTHDESDEIFLEVCPPTRHGPTATLLGITVALTRQCDRDEDGQLSFEEFKLAFGEDDVDGEEGDFGSQVDDDDDDD